MPPGVVDGRRRRLLEHAEHLEPGELTCAPRRLDLRRVEVRRYRDHRAIDPHLDAVGRAVLQMRAHRRAELFQNLRGHLFGRELVGPHRDLHVASHPPLDRLDRRRIEAAPIARGAPDQELFLRRIPCEGGGDGLPTEAVLVHQQVTLGGIEDRHLRVGGSEIDANGSVDEHGVLFSSSRGCGTVQDHR